MCGTAAATVFGPRFFPQISPIAATLASFATFGVGLITRPIGGIVMGHFGDRLGRKSMLVWSLMLMGSSTIGIGLLPDYSQIGVWAPALLIVLRLLQGFALGGEYLIAAKKAEHTVSILCRCLPVTRSGCYAWRRRPESTHTRDDQRLKVLVRASFEEK